MNDIHQNNQEMKEQLENSTGPVSCTLVPLRVCNKIIINTFCRDSYKIILGPLLS